MDGLTMGVEEEYLVVELDSGRLVPRAAEVLQEASTVLGEEVTPELNRCQVEVATPVCSTRQEVEDHLRRLRLALQTSASSHRLGILAASTHPSSSWKDQRVDEDQARFRRLREQYGITADRQVIVGCHVHVGIDDPDLVVAAMDRVRPWLPVLLALSANSPFWEGRDTGYASYRTEVWRAWPTSGCPPQLGCRQEYESVVSDLQAAGVIDDDTFLYWNVRPSAHHPTLEYRITDVCLRVEDAATIAALARALTWVAADAVLRDVPLRPVRTELLEAAVWRAARFGLADHLVSPSSHAARPAGYVVAELLEHLRPGLEAHGDLEAARRACSAILQRGTGADVQRRLRRRHRRWGATIADLTARTARPLARSAAS